MKAYRIEYKKVIVAYRSWWRPVYDFRFCVIEIDEKIVCLPPTYLDTISPYPDYEGMCRKHTVETLLHKFEHEKDALEKLEFLNRYNTG